MWDLSQRGTTQSPGPITNYPSIAALILVIGRLQRLRQDPGLPDHRHEVGVRHPARQGVHMDVSRHPRSGGFADIHPQIDPVRLVESRKIPSIRCARSIISWAASAGSFCNSSRWAKGTIITCPAV